MKKLLNLKSFTLAFLVVITAACGNKMAGNYSLTETGGAAQTNPACGMVNLVISENNNAVTGSAQNSCFTQTLNGTDLGNGTMNVTVVLTPIYGATGYQSTTSACTYTGTMTVSGNAVTGTLTQTQTYGGYGSLSCGTTLTLNGTKN